MFDIMSVLVEADTYCVSCFSYVLEFPSGDDAITRKVSGRVEEMLEVRPEHSGQASGRGGGGRDKGDALPLERRTSEGDSDLAQDPTEDSQGPSGAQLMVPEEDPQPGVSGVSVSTAHCPFMLPVGKAGF
ncbi:unnamed protein product [Gadus morhua 'NCC']